MIGDSALHAVAMDLYRWDTVLLVLNVFVFAHTAAHRNFFRWWFLTIPVNVLIGVIWLARMIEDPVIYSLSLVPLTCLLAGIVYWVFYAARRA